MITATTRWYSPEDKKPRTSGECMIVTESGTLLITNYSKIHDAFNAYDEIENDHEIKVKYWASIPKKLGEVSL